MYPLIEITSVPIEIRMKTTSASLEYTRGTAEMEISRSDKGIDIKSRPIQLKLDTYEQRGGGERYRSASPATAAVTPQGVKSVPNAALAGRETAYEATSAYSEQGQIMLNARFGQSAAAGSAVSNPAPQTVNQSSNPAAVSDALGDFQLGDGQMEIRYEMDKLNFDWKIDTGSFEFTPGDIEISVEQQPKVIIKYVGGPIYVPRSADPNYEPVDVKA